MANSCQSTYPIFCYTSQLPGPCSFTGRPGIVGLCTPQPTLIPTSHELVCTTLTFPSTPVPPMPAPRHTRRLHKINKKAFSQDLLEKDVATFPPEQSVDIVWKSWTEKSFTVYLTSKHPRPTHFPRPRTHIHRFCVLFHPSLETTSAPKTGRPIVSSRKILVTCTSGSISPHLRKEARRLSRSPKNDFFSSAVQSTLKASPNTFQVRLLAKRPKETVF